MGVLAVLSACAAVAMPGAVAGRQPPAALPPSAYLDDFDSAWTFIRDNYAYFEEKSVDWEQVRNLLRPRATAIRDRGEFIGLLEDLVEHLYDHHAHLGVNTPSSPRLVPSGADLWAVHRGGTALITQVRVGSDGERAGLRPGMEIVSIDGRPVADAVEGRLPSALDREDPAARDWALRVPRWKRRFGGCEGSSPSPTPACGRRRGRASRGVERDAEGGGHGRGQGGAAKGVAPRVARDDRR